MSKGKPFITLVREISKNREEGTSVLLIESAGDNHTLTFRTGGEATIFHQIASGMHIINEALILAEEEDLMNEIEESFGCRTMKALVQLSDRMGSKECTDKENVDIKEWN